MRFGVATDRMLAGNIGGMKRLNFAVVGDGINLSARLEGANKVYGTDVMISGTTRALCPDTMAFRHLDRIQVKGRDEALDVFEPLGIEGEVDAETLERAARFEAALERYWAGAFKDAAKRFATLAKHDLAAAHFAKVARAYAKDAPGPDWDGVNRLKTK
jgi:adenylate cyclase